MFTFEKRSKTITLIAGASAITVVLILFSQGTFDFGPPSPIPNVTMTIQDFNITPRFDANFECTGVALHARFNVRNLDNVDGFVEVAIIREVDGFKEVSNLFFIEVNGAIQDTLRAESTYCDPELDPIFETTDFEVKIVDVRGR